MPRPSLLDHFSALDDPRQRGKVLYPLPEIMLLILCATLSGAEDFVETQAWGSTKLPFLRGILPFKHGIPSHDTLNDVINALDGALFSEAFTAWVDGLREAEPDIVAIDGKTSRRAHAGGHPLHMVSAWATRQRLVLGQQATSDKSNEISAIPLLLERLHLTGALVTIDAMGTQTKIAKCILARGADYLLALKDNQKSLATEVALFFDTTGRRGPVHTTTDGDHGRIETRSHWVSTSVDWLQSDRNAPGEPRFPGLKAVAMVEALGRTRRKNHHLAPVFPVIAGTGPTPARPSGPRPLGHREPPALGAGCRLPRRPDAPANRPRAEKYGHNQTHGHEPDPRCTGKTQPQNQTQDRRMGSELSQNHHNSGEEMTFKRFPWAIQRPA